MTQFAEFAPAGLTPIRLFPPTLTNHQVLLLALSVVTPGPVTMPVPNYIAINANLAEERLLFASKPRLFENIRRFNHYVPNALVRDVSCSLAGLETAYTANLGNFTGAVLAIGGGRGFGPYMDDQLTQIGGSDKALLLEPAFGHIDHFMTPQHRQFVELPILHWLQRLW